MRYGPIDDLSIVFLGFLVVLAGCGEDLDAPRDTTPPTVIETTPPDGATDVGLLQPFTFRFSEAMDPATLNDATVSVHGEFAAGLFTSYDRHARTLWVAPDSLWTPEADLQLEISGARDAFGNALPDVAVDFSTGPDDCDHRVDYLEPNDETATAPRIELDRVYPALSTCGSDNADFYRFTLAETLSVTIRTNITHAQRRPWMLAFVRDDAAVYNSLSTTARTGASPSERYSFAPGTYFAVVWSIPPFLPYPVLYDLVLETSLPCRDDLDEDNDFRDTAVPIEPGVRSGLLGCRCDADYYSTEVSAGQIVTATATSDPYLWTERTLKIYGPDGEYFFARNLDNPITGSIETTASGTAYIMIEFDGDGVSDSLDVAVTE
jgi:hypothetical protein